MGSLLLFAAYACMAAYAIFFKAPHLSLGGKALVFLVAISIAGWPFALGALGSSLRNRAKRNR